MRRVRTQNYPSNLPQENQRLTARAIGYFALIRQAPAGREPGTCALENTGRGEDHGGHRGHRVGFRPPNGPMTPMPPLCLRRSGSKARASAAVPAGRNRAAALLGIA